MDSRLNLNRCPCWELILDPFTSKANPWSARLCYLFSPSNIAILTLTHKNLTKSYRDYRQNMPHMVLYNLPSLSIAKERLTCLNNVPWSLQACWVHFFLHPPQGFFLGGWGVSPIRQKFCQSPHLTLVPVFGPRLVPPQPRFVPENLKNLNTFLCQIWLLLSSKVP